MYAQQLAKAGTKHTILKFLINAVKPIWECLHEIFATNVYLIKKRKKRIESCGISVLILLVLNEGCLIVQSRANAQQHVQERIPRIRFRLLDARVHLLLALNSFAFKSFEDIVSRGVPATRHERILPTRLHRETCGTRSHWTPNINKPKVDRTRQRERSFDTGGTLDYRGLSLSGGRISRLKTLEEGSRTNSLPREKETRRRKKAHGCLEISVVSRGEGKSGRWWHQRDLPRNQPSISERFQDTHRRGLGSQAPGCKSRLDW